MIRVLFVCLGNICRSPIAEGVFEELIRKRKLESYISCDSAGTAGYHVGSLADRRMRNVARTNGIELKHRARQFDETDFDEFHYILAMDSSNFEYIRRESVQKIGVYLPENQLYLYRMFDPQREGAMEVPDPYYEDQAAFEQVFDIVRRSGIAFLDFLIEKHNLNHSVF